MKCERNSYQMQSQCTLTKRSRHDQESGDRETSLKEVKIQTGLILRRVTVKGEKARDMEVDES
jgi:hypothetical protein